jgi:M6 family metalloprotease-like protein
MRRGVIVLFLLLLVPIVLAVPANPIEYPCEEGSNIMCTTIGDFHYSESFTLDENGELGCPISFEDGKAFYAQIAASGYFEKSSLSLKDLTPENVEKIGSIICGYENLKKVRPSSPVPDKALYDMWNEKRILANADKGIGVKYEDDGTITYLNPQIVEYVEEYVPPSLQEPKPEIEITGLATFNPSFEEQTIKVLVVLVDFTDKKGKKSPSQINEMFFGQGGLADYYEAQSYGAFKIEGAVTPSWYTLSNTMGYYGSNNERNVEDMIVEAVHAADADIDFTTYDGDGDNVIDAFFVVHAGKADEDGGGNGDEIWSHYYSISGEVADGVEVIDYETVSEDSPIGIVAHEFGHYLGLPDLYDTNPDDGNSKGTGEWSIMGYGGYLDNPGSFDPWSKSYLGWLNDNNFKTVQEDGFYDILQDDSSIGTRYYSVSLSSNELFMLENRHETRLMKGGTAGGVLVWHIDEGAMLESGSWFGCSGTRWDCNVVNGDASHKFIDVEEIGKQDLDNNKLGDGDDVWLNDCSSRCSTAEFYSLSDPASSGYAGGVDVGISVNSDVASSMSVGISLSGELLYADVVEEAAEDGIREDVAIDDNGFVQKDEEVQEGFVGSSSPSSGSSNPTLFIVLGFLGVVVLVAGGFIAYTFMGGKGGSLSPRDFKKFNNR